MIIANGLCFSVLLKKTELKAEKGIMKRTNVYRQNDGNSAYFSSFVFTRNCQFEHKIPFIKEKRLPTIIAER